MTKRSLTSATLLVGAFSVLVALTAQADSTFSDNFSAYDSRDNPWTGVDGSGQLKVLQGDQIAVDDSGLITNMSSGPSVAVGDLNGDGLPDLVVADARGYFWYYQNHGTKDVPKFTTGEIMPIWLADQYTYDNFYWPNEGGDGICTHNYVPRIQLIQRTPGGLYDLVVGSYIGKLYLVKNTGSKKVPSFQMPSTLADITIPTHKDGKLWVTYLAPYLFDWNKKGRFDLVVGDGTYSANSIFFLSNKGNNEQPMYNEDFMAKSIPGMGREHLVPQVVSWNGDGKQDILATERLGYLNLFLNTGTDAATGFPTFDQGTHIPIGGQDKLDEQSTATMTSLEDGKLPGFIIGTPDGHISYAENTGTATAFAFGAPTPLTGTPNTRPQILVPQGWSLKGGFGSPFQLLVITNAQVEKTFKPPAPGINNALRFYVDEPNPPQKTFPHHYYPTSDLHSFECDRSFSMKGGTHYKLTFWLMTTGNISNLHYSTHGFQWDPVRSTGAWQDFTGNVQTSEGQWSQSSEDLKFSSVVASDDKATTGFNISFLFNGNGSIYMADMKLEEGQ